MVRLNKFDDEFNAYLNSIVGYRFYSKAELPHYLKYCYLDVFLMYYLSKNITCLSLKIKREITLNYIV